MTREEVLKMIYDKTAEHHRFFLLWRQYLLAGYFALIGTLLYSSYILIQGVYAQLVCVPFFIITFLAIMFYFLDSRNAELYQVCQKTGKAIEEELLGNLNNTNTSRGSIALFHSLDNSHSTSPHPSHRTTVSIIYIISAVISALIFLFLLFIEIAKAY